MVKLTSSLSLLYIMVICILYTRTHTHWQSHIHNIQLVNYTRQHIIWTNKNEQEDEDEDSEWEGWMSQANLQISFYPAQLFTSVSGFVSDDFTYSYETIQLKLFFILDESNYLCHWTLVLPFMQLISPITGWCTLNWAVEEVRSCFLFFLAINVLLSHFSFP